MTKVVIPQKALHTVTINTASDGHERLEFEHGNKGISISVKGAYNELDLYDELVEVLEQLLDGIDERVIGNGVRADDVFEAEEVLKKVKEIGKHD